MKARATVTTIKRVDIEVEVIVKSEWLELDPVEQHDKIIDADSSSEDWQQRIAHSKFNQVKDIFKNPKGRIQLQDHGSQVWFREITIRELDAGPDNESNAGTEPPPA